MNGIFYFSSTGNSLYLAKKIQSELNGNVSTYLIIKAMAVNMIGL